jgi:hypothetical protein
MPYFIFRIEPPLRLTWIDTRESYRDARQLVREHRKARPDGDDSEYRMVFANSQGEAEQLLSTPRDERVIGED